MTLLVSGLSGGASRGRSGGCGCSSMGDANTATISYPFLGTPSPGVTAGSTISDICSGLDAASCQAAINYYSQTGTPVATPGGAGSLIPGLSNSTLILAVMGIIGVLVLSKG